MAEQRCSQLSHPQVKFQISQQIHDIQTDLCRFLSHRVIILFYLVGNLREMFSYFSIFYIYIFAKYLFNNCQNHIIGSEIEVF